VRDQQDDPDPHAHRAQHGDAWRFTVDLRRGVPTLLGGGAIPFIPGNANELSWDIAPGCGQNQCIPVESVEPLARAITAAIEIPTIGIGASPVCDGQVLVTDDMIGLFSDFTPRFVKRYADVGTDYARAAESYAADVRARAFPGPEHCFGVSKTKGAD